MFHILVDELRVEVPERAGDDLGLDVTEHPAAAEEVEAEAVEAVLLAGGDRRRREVEARRTDGADRLVRVDEVGDGHGAGRYASTIRRNGARRRPRPSLIGRGPADRDVRLGFGGLTVARAADRPAARPRTSSTSATPAATRTARSRSAEVRGYADELAWSLVKDHEVKAIVVACNTAAAAGLEDLRAELPCPVLDVIEPGATALVQATTTGGPA